MEKGLHPTQKNLKLMEELVKIHSNVGMTVVDPFSGSFTTGVACANLGRVFIGIEMDDKYFDIGVQRLKDVYNGNIKIS